LKNRNDELGLLQIHLKIWQTNYKKG
jgi:hypothetical protein